MAEIPKTFRAWSLLENGIEHLQLIEREIPQNLGEHDILVRVRGAGLNPIDFKQCIWGSGPFDQQFPRSLGEDFSGIVVKIGGKVDPNHFRMNETVVFSFGGFKDETGSFGEYKVVDSRHVNLVSHKIVQSRGEHIFTDLAALPAAGFTALACVQNKLKLPIHKDPQSISNRYTRNIFVTAGAGGVGSFILQLLRLWRENNFDEHEKKNIRIITSCSKNNFEYVMKLGATHSIDYNVEDMCARLKEILEGDQLDVWIDLVGKESAQRGSDCLGFRGELVVVFESDYSPKLYPFSQTVHNVALGQYQFLGAPKHMKDYRLYGELLLELYYKKQIEIEKREIKLEEVQQALIEISEGHTRGKIVMKI
ncbi:zinc-binding dehydrogenase family oxidoreductase (macronuclear) [Tetrahymena thermophila SB210]|uniref:Zinc-binding dehydrogenase family oxidoreductase n=1 Tax=Tetrahymena thermophila (strain SB210) TaxID=312017 RepID=Q23WV8_TETTS|nr:zinc-binding dehydrogenase family oxidoreductase [Tetrahymena thermophila SB210]EAS00987.2 zinc-binding dehydrogenase family oxidoreductase [Tetrahymena thermophila SB210]|eukprot:XP_001021232.2 zinc-binding dehydrogenase family oxidoreductase [Tetrahymena thermophila SB210]